MFRPLAIALVLISCGQPPAPLPEILPPNTEQACERAVACGAYLPDQKNACVACLENGRPTIEEMHDLPPADEVDCETITTLAKLVNNLDQCVAERWFGP